MNSRSKTVEQHIRRFYSGHGITEHQWTLGPVAHAMLGRRVLCIGPGSRTPCWSYVSVGASAIEHEDTDSVEFVLLAHAEDLRHVELVTMATWYHKTEKLGIGYTLPIGEPWLDQSRCDHFLVSLLYPFGPDLEICPCEDGVIRFLWLLPITKAERDDKAAKGLEALEKIFDESELEYWNAARQSVC